MNRQNSFAGFPQGALDFLRELALNNNKAWFDAHKADYQQAILDPAPAFISALGERLQAIQPAIEYDARVNGSGSLMRIYRDVRFSANKTPYKSHAAFVFWEGPRKKMENPAFGFQFNAAGGELMTGQFAFPKELIGTYRAAVLAEKTGGELVALLAQINQVGGYGLSEPEYKRVPAGFDAEHPRALLLRYAGLYGSVGHIPPTHITSAELVDVLAEHFRVLAPLHRWLVRLNAGY